MRWTPPFTLYHAGRQEVFSTAYRNDTAQVSGPRRLLVKHTLSGRGVLYVRGKRHALPPGAMFVIERPGPYMYCFEPASEPWRFEYISIVYSSPAGLLPPGMREYPILAASAHEDLCEQLAELIDLRLRESYRQELMHSALAYRFFLSYIAIRQRESAGDGGAAAALRAMLEDPSVPARTIGDMAQEAGYTQEALTRLFRKTYGIAPGRYAKRVRLRRACRLLEEGRLPLKQVAAACGFPDANYFGRAFKQEMGVTPGQYRRNPDPLLGSL